MKPTRKHPNGHAAVSLRGEVYDLIANAAEKRGVSMTQIIDEALCPALGLLPVEHRLAYRHRTDRRIDVTARAHIQVKKVARATCRSMRDVFDAEINRALDRAERK